MKLLIQTKPAELPEEALLARLRCRRADINLAAGEEALASADVVIWVYRRLNRRLHKRLEPFLEQLAMRSLVLALRYTLAGESPPATILRHSLLAANLQKLVNVTADAESLVARLEEVLVADYPFVAGLNNTFRSQGPGGVEQQLVDGILQHGLRRQGNATISGTLGYMVDMRNCLMVHKLWRWQVNLSPPLTAGGSIVRELLHRIWATHDSDRLSKLATRLAGEPANVGKSAALEQCLLNGMTRFLRQQGQDPLGLGVIIEYLWHAQLATHNQLLRQTLVYDRQELLEEVLLL